MNDVRHIAEERAAQPKKATIRTRLEEPEKHEIRQTKSDLRTVEQRGTACPLAGGMGERRQPRAGAGRIGRGRRSPQSQGPGT